VTATCPSGVLSTRQRHRGSTPRMMAQPAVHVRDGFALDGSGPSPVARAIMAGLAMTDRS